MAETGSLTSSLPMSPGQVSTQRAILEVQKHQHKYKESVDMFVEEAMVRRELAENFCYYNENYDSVQGSFLVWVGSTWAGRVPNGHPNLAIARLTWRGAVRALICCHSVLLEVGQELVDALFKVDVPWA